MRSCSAKQGTSDDDKTWELLMAKLIYAALTSLDGYISDDTGNFDWATPTYNGPQSSPLA
jgi:hypothetical protein